MCYLPVFVHISVLLICLSMCIYITQSCPDKCIYAIMFPFRYTHTYKYIYICICVYIYVYIYRYTYIQYIHLYRRMVMSISGVHNLLTSIHCMVVVFHPLRCKINDRAEIWREFRKIAVSALAEILTWGCLKMEDPLKKITFGFNNLGNLEVALF